MLAAEACAFVDLQGVACGKSRDAFSHMYDGKAKQPYVTIVFHPFKAGGSHA